ncbi:hypothetical protein D3C85_1663070 [compost metagenome]
MQIELALHLAKQVRVRLMEADPDDGVGAASPFPGVLHMDVLDAHAVFVDCGSNHALSFFRMRCRRVRVARPCFIRQVQRHRRPPMSA